MQRPATRIRCRVCGVPTTNTSDQLCGGCWEFDHRREDIFENAPIEYLEQIANEVAQAIQRRLRLLPLAICFHRCWKDSTYVVMVGLVRGGRIARWLLREPGQLDAALAWLAFDIHEPAEPILAAWRNHEPPLGAWWMTQFGQGTPTEDDNVHEIIVRGGAS